MLSSAQKNRAERLFHWKQDGVKALSEHETREQATRLLTAKLRAERLARSKWQADEGRESVTKKASAFRDDIKIEFGGRQSQNRSRSRARSHVDMSG